MTPLRITAETSRQFDSLKARMARLQATLGPGATTTEALKKARAELSAMRAEAAALSLSLGQEIAGAGRREREDRAVRRAS